ncbi:SAM-dependent methyltransferase [Streptomyces spectabilis]|uniref:SAM-dependent methyltransferase n=1 Tax=Streptomyces spectabilis TaxID=68270 RepID=A0A7W8B5I6_STRST|nr:SAM-dependent methyltransferase [Streptomyces spectabilis]MBB5109565.1 SAM-dependent methyltransferase [Streptomyces spectabilis]GGV55768.1 hypothetical protein GCM10010245_88470 [Streptomyces spectabilis]
MTELSNSPGRPSPARIYDCMLGGTANEQCDRDAVAKVLEVFPEAPAMARANRAFALAAVRLCASLGIRQFVDMGAGIPTHPSVFETARAYSPGARVVGVDCDPVVFAHGADSVANSPNILIEGDIRDPDRLFSDPQLLRLIDLDESVAVLLVTVLHFISDEENPVGIVARIRDRLAPGSVLVVSHACSTGSDSEAIRRIERLYQQSSGAFYIRGEHKIRELFCGLPLREPGHLVDVQQWATDAAPSKSAIRLVAGVSDATPA